MALSSHCWGADVHPSRGLLENGLVVRGLGASMSLVDGEKGCFHCPLSTPRRAALVPTNAWRTKGLRSSTNSTSSVSIFTERGGEDKEEGLYKG